MELRAKFDSHIIPDSLFEKFDGLIDIPAKNLLSMHRIDLVAKLIYIDAVVKEEGISFARDLYKAHLAAFSAGSFVEPGKDKVKNSFEAYEKTFLDIIDSIRNESFNSDISIIPITMQNILLDGSHRVASSIYFNKTIRAGFFDKETRLYDYKFFKERMLDGKYLDYMIFKYLQLQGESVYTACLWPSAYSADKEVENALIQGGIEIVYKKEINFTVEGAHSFLYQIYSHDFWIGDIQNKFKGVYNKLEPCFGTFKKPMVLYVCDLGKKGINLLELKDNIRSTIGLGKHSLHITDTHDQSLQIAELLLNGNSIHHMNFGEPLKYGRTFENLLILYRKIKTANLRTDDFVVDSSSVMELYGLRKAEDMDYISEHGILHELKGINKRKEIDVVNLYSVEDLNNPDNYFYFNRIKCMTLNLVRNMKKNRGEVKDIEDVYLIDRFKKRNLSNTENLQVILIKAKRELRYWKIRAKNSSVRLMKKIGIFEKVKSMIMLFRELLK